MAKDKQGYYKNLQDLYHFNKSYLDIDVFEDSDHTYAGPVRKKSESGIDFDQYDPEGPKKPLDFLQARDIIASIVEFHKLGNCNIKFYTDQDPTDEKDRFRLTCHDYVFVDDSTEKEYKDKCLDIIKLIRRDFKKETGKALKCTVKDNKFHTQFYGRAYGDLPVPGADVQMNVKSKNRSFVSHTCDCEYSM